MRIKIKQSGEIIGVPGIKYKIRTPMEFDISENNLGKTVLSLIRQGITNFEIKQKDKDIEENYENVLSSNYTSEIKDKINQMEDKLNTLIDKVDNMEHREIPTSENIKEEKVSTKSKNKIVDEDDEDDDFIPNVHLDGFEKHGDGKEKVERKSDMEENAQNLSEKLNKKES